MRAAAAEAPRRGGDVRAALARAARLLTWRRACAYATVLVGLYAVAWLYVLLAGAPPLNVAGEPLGGDYIAFHAAGRTILDGEAARLYARAQVVAVQDALLGGRIPNFYDAFRNPPFFALLFVPLAALPLLWGAAVWTALSLVCLALALRLLLDDVPALRPRWRGLVLLVLAFPPVYFGLVDGENASLSLLLYVLFFRALGRDQSVRAGLWAAVGLFKPQLFFLFPLILLATRRWRAVAAYIATAVALAAISLALVGPDGIAAWLAILFQAESSNATATAWRMASLSSFFAQLLPGHSTVALTCYAISAVALTILLLREWATRRIVSPTLVALTVTVAVLVDPHLVDYDLSVLVAAGVLVLARLRGLKWSVVALYVVLLARAQVPFGTAALQLGPVVLLAITWLVTHRVRRAVPPVGEGGHPDSPPSPGAGLVARAGS